MEIGAKLKGLRLRRGLTQEELADRCELSKGFISQVERDQASPSIATLTDLLECLGSTLKEFFSDDGNEKTVYTRADMVVKEDADALRGRITWLVPNAQKNSRTDEPKDCRTRPARTDAMGIIPWQPMLMMLLTLLSLSLSTTRMIAVLIGMLMKASNRPVTQPTAQNAGRKTFRLFPRSTSSQ